MKRPLEFHKTDHLAKDESYTGDLIKSPYKGGSEKVQ